jgi:5,10-methylenetetrahydromethanopterin reductase
VQYTPCCVGPDRDRAFQLARRAVGEMLPVYWALGARLAAANSALMEGSGIAEAEFAAVAERLRAGEDAAAVLDDRFAAAFAIAGTAADCRAQLAACARAGITEIALTFAGPDAAADIAYLGAALHPGRIQGNSRNHPP